MKSFVTISFTAIFCLGLIAGQSVQGTVPLGVAASTPKKHLRAFSSEAELKNFLKKIVRKKRGGGGGGGVGYGSGNGDVDGASAGVQMTVTVTADSGSARESITNTQHAGVDEGGIVKTHGDHLVVLRRGRLFTIAIGDNSLTPVSSINAFAPDIDPEGTWYDEMLISDDNIVVVGYSYDRGGTEIGLFKINREGGLRFRSTYHLRSNDYYSSRNYSSRLIGDKLIFYSPLSISWDAGDIFGSFPALRKWHKGAKAGEFRRIASAQSIYRPVTGVDYDDALALHTVTTCDLSNPELTCDATSVLGPPGNVFYVSAKSVYVWATPWNYSDDNKEQNRSLLFRMPLDGLRPSALRVSGSPVDQFSFLEDEKNDLNILVRAESEGDGMWSGEVSEGEIALLRVSPVAFADGSTAAPRSSYQELENVGRGTFQNRFVGDYLLYGTGSGWGPPSTKPENKLHTVNRRSGAASEIVIPHGVDRLDALANDGIVVGTDGNDLFFTSVRLDGTPRVIDTFKVEGAVQGETRSQGFFYKANGADSGILGLPIASEGRPGYRQLRDGSASMIFLRNDSLKLSELGRLRSVGATSIDDGCKASCVDWYGNARPIFVRGRIFALLGYEIVEGRVTSTGVDEIRRVDFSPRAPRAASR